MDQVDKANIKLRRPLPAGPRHHRHLLGFADPRPSVETIPQTDLLFLRMIMRMRGRREREIEREREI